MNIDQMLVIIGGLMLTIIGYFLKETMDDLKKVKATAYETKTKVEVLEAEYMGKIENLNSKFDLLYEGIKDLTKEIKRLNEKIK